MPDTDLFTAAKMLIMVLRSEAEYGGATDPARVMQSVDRLDKLLTAAIEADHGDIFIESKVAKTTFEPIVVIRWADQVAELTVEEARRHALGILQCCEAAMGDHLVCRLLDERIGVDVEAIAHILQDFRVMREERRRADD